MGFDVSRRGPSLPRQIFGEYFDPFREMDIFRDNIFDDFNSIFTARTNKSVRSYKKDDAIFFEFDVPGMTSEDVEVSLDHDMLSVTASKSSKDTDMVWRNSFSYSAHVPNYCDKTAEASIENGVLTVGFPIKAAEKSDKIKIDVKKKS